MEPNNQKKEGAVKKLGDFLGVSKFGQGMATAYRYLKGDIKNDIQRQEQATANVDKILYAARQEKDPKRRTMLLRTANDMANLATEMSVEDIDPGVNLSNKEILGSAANIGLNILTPGGFKGSKGAIIAKNAALGAGFGAASGMEKNRSAGGIVGSATGGAILGAGLGVAQIAAKAFKDFATKTTPTWLMNKAIKPTLDETRKSIKFGNKTLGQELLEEGVAGNPHQLLQVADDKLTSLEDDLQKVLSSPEMAQKRITRNAIKPYLDDLIRAKEGTPGMKGDVQRIKDIVDSVPEELTLQEANQMKRRIYNELRDVSYKLDAKLGAKAKTLKIIASGLKQEIEKAVGGDTIYDINRQLSLYGRLEDRIVDQLARAMRNNSISLTDSIFLSGGLASMKPLGVLASISAAVGRNVVGSTGFRSRLAQRLVQLRGMGTGKAAETAGGLLKRAYLNAP